MQSTCVSKLMLTGLSGSERNLLLLLVRTERMNSDVSGICRMGFSSLYVFFFSFCEHCSSVHKFSLLKDINLSSHLKVSAQKRC